MHKIPISIQDHEYPVKCVAQTWEHPEIAIKAEKDEESFRATRLRLSKQLDVTSASGNAAAKGPMLRLDIRTWHSCFHIISLKQSATYVGIVASDRAGEIRT